MGASLGLQAVSGAISAASTLAGGRHAAEAGALAQQQSAMQAKQIRMNASQALASGQRRMFERQERTRMAVSSNVARAGASGVDAGSGSPAFNAGALEGRGSYQALMDLFNGQSEATGLRNQADAVEYEGALKAWEGEARKRASRLAAIGTLAGTAGNVASTYGKFTYPTSRGAPGVSL